MKSVVVKIGGSIADTKGFFAELAQSIAPIMGRSFLMVVHGGGKAIARMLDSMNKEFRFVEGMRVTDAETMAMVQMVLSGDVNKSIVNAMVSNGVTALGLSGVDCGLFTAEKLLVKGADIGFVGEVKRVDARIIELCRQSGIVPVVSPVSRGVDGAVYNVNADVAAGDLAEALRVDDLVFVSDVKGVLIDGAVRRTIKTGEIESLIDAGHVTGGMIPKLRSASEAVHKGVGRVHICGWTGIDTLERELFGEACGTVIEV